MKIPHTKKLIGDKKIRERNTKNNTIKRQKYISDELIGHHNTSNVTSGRSYSDQFGEKK